MGVSVNSFPPGVRERIRIAAMNRMTVVNRKTFAGSGVVTPSGDGSSHTNTDTKQHAAAGDFWRREEDGRWFGVIHIAPMGAPRMSRRDKFKPSQRVQAYFTYCNTIRLRMPVIERPWRLQVRAFIQMPESWSGAKKARMVGKLVQVRPDWDNIGKGVCDAMFEEDGMIGGGESVKFWSAGAGRLEICVWTGEPADVNTWENYR